MISIALSVTHLLADSLDFGLLVKTFPAAAEVFISHRLAFYFSTVLLAPQLLVYLSELCVCLTKLLQVALELQIKFI